MPDAILGLLAAQDSNIDDGWTHLPVQELATTFGKCRKTGQRVIERLERDGMIVTVVNTARRNGRPVRERWARLVERKDSAT